MHATPALLANLAGSAKPASVCELFDAEIQRAERRNAVRREVGL